MTNKPTNTPVDGTHPITKVELQRLSKILLASGSPSLMLVCGTCGGHSKHPGREPPFPCPRCGVIITEVVDL